MISPNFTFWPPFYLVSVYLVLHVKQVHDPRSNCKAKVNLSLQAATRAGMACVITYTSSTAEQVRIIDPCST